MDEYQLSEGLGEFRKRIDGFSVGYHVVAVAGGSASGKGYILDHFLTLPGIARVAIDNYYLSGSGGSGVCTNHDEPRALDLKLLMEHLLALKDGKGVDVPIYNFINGMREGSYRQEPCRIIILDGLFAFYDQGFQDVADLKVYVEASDEVRLSRRLKRDVEERGRTEEGVLIKWERTVLPMHNLYVSPQKELADLVIVNN